MSRKRTLVLAAASVGASLALPASAVDVKSVHGAACQGSGAGSAVYDGTGLTASGAVTAHCGLTRDRTTNSKNLASIYVEVYNAASGAIPCTAYSQREDLTTTDAATVLYTQSAASGSAVGNLQVGSLAPTAFLTSAGNEGSYTVECDLSDSDVLYHVYISEKSTLD